MKTKESKLKAQQEQLDIPVVRQRLLFEMKRILNEYKRMNLFCYELYTLMNVFSTQNKYDYDINIHTDLLNVA